MASFLHSKIAQRIFLIAVPLALCLLFLFPGIASAHAILLRSDPPQDAKLNAAPQQVHMWFSEDLNPAFTTAVVVNAENVRVDKGDAHVSNTDSKEMDVSLKPNLPPAVYVVVWRTDSADDGHILRGSFIFSVKEPNGTVPTLSPGSNPGQNALGGGNLTGLYTGQLDGPTSFNLVMITLVELGAVFWVGAQLWLTFVLQPASEDHQDLRETNSRVERRFQQRFSLLTLIVLFLANIGVLVGQAIFLTGGQWNTALDPTLLIRLATSGRFGTFWIMREITVLLALLIALYMLLFKSRPRLVNILLPYINLADGLALFIAISMSSHASAVSSNIVVLAVVIDWLHLLAAALWVGGMMFIATTYLPILRRISLPEQALSLVTMLPYFSVLAFIGVGLMAVTGPFSATFHLTSWNQLISTAYGRALSIKILLIGGLLLTSAYHVGLLQPRLKKEYKKYAYASKRLENVGAPFIVPDRSSKLIAQQVRLREGRLEKGTRRLTSILTWEPLLGVAILICVGLMNVFAGTLSPIALPQQPANASPKPYTTTVRTTDNKFTVMLSVNPDHFGTNVFTVTVIDNSTGKPTTNVGVSLYTTMLDMDMGTDTVNLLPDGKGHFSADGDLTMAGHWQIRIQIRTPDDTLHETTVRLLVPF